jgi:hypothetical protein
MTCIVLAILTAAGIRAQQAPEQPIVPPEGDIWRFDFGPADSPVGDGFLPVLPDTTWDAERGYGYVEEPARATAFDQNRRVVRDTLVLDDVTRDGIYGGPAFRVDLPDGAWRVAVLSGQYSRPGANRPDSHFREYSITAGDEVLYQQGDTPDEFFDPQGRYFANYHRDWHPDVDLYTTNIARWIPWGEAPVQVAGGMLEIAPGAYAPINAIFIYPDGSEAGQAALADFRARQRSFFNQQYPWQQREPERETPQPPAEMTAAGAAVWVRTNADDLRPSTRPIPQDYGRPMRLFASPGEREFGVAAVLPLRDVLGEIDLVASDLVGDDGTIPADALDIRYVRYGEYPVTDGYEVRPHFLVPWRPERMEAGLTRGFQVDLHTPEDARPGLYEGTLTLTGFEQELALPLQVRVLPLELPMSDLYAGVYAGNLQSTTFRHYRTMREMPDEMVTRALSARMHFLADQGFTGLYDSLGWWPFELGEGGELIRTEVWDYYLEVFRMADSIPEFSEMIFPYYLGGPQMFPKIPGFLRRHEATKLPIDEIRFSDEAIDGMTRMLTYFYETIRAEDLPEVVFYVQDELGNDGAKGARYGRELLRAINECRERVPGGFRTAISTLRASIAREYLDEADIVMPNAAYPVTGATIDELRAHDCTLGLYNMGATRFSYGFYPWRVDAINRAQWSFSYDGDNSDPFVSLPSGARYSCDCHFTPQWEVLPSIGMLNQREGVDDYRYVQLLEEMLAEADGDSEAAGTARRTLDELTEAVSRDYLDPSNNWDRSTMDYWRWRVARAAIDLQAELR